MAPFLAVAFICPAELSSALLHFVATLCETKTRRERFKNWCNTECYFNTSLPSFAQPNNHCLLNIYFEKIKRSPKHKSPHPFIPVVGLTHSLIQWVSGRFPRDRAAGAWR
jgi:hypothetical protein